MRIVLDDYSWTEMLNGFSGTIGKGGGVERAGFLAGIPSYSTHRTDKKPHSLDRCSEGIVSPKLRLIVAISMWTFPARCPWCRSLLTWPCRGGPSVSLARRAYLTIIALVFRSRHIWQPLKYITFSVSFETKGQLQKAKLGCISLWGREKLRAYHFEWKPMDALSARPFHQTKGDGQMTIITCRWPWCGPGSRTCRPNVQ